jgi:ABC-type multidrug transport system fused ATPase/permease subunit
VVIHDGRIVEQGTHAELVEKRGYYFQLYSSGFED